MTEFEMKMKAAAEGRGPRQAVAPRFHAVRAGLRHDAGRRQHAVRHRRPRRAQEGRHLQGGRRPWPDDRLARSRHLVQRLHLRLGQVGDGRTARPDQSRRTKSSRMWPKASSPPTARKKWIFKIRKGITFHNGKTLTADDVVATINYHIGPDSKSPAKGVLTNRHVGQGGRPRHGGRSTSTAATPTSPTCSRTITCRSIPPEDGKIQWEKGIGAGPYILKSYRAGREARLRERNPNYFGTPGSMRIEVLIDHRRGGPHQRLSLGRGAFHRPRRPQDHRHAEERTRTPSSTTCGHRALHGTHAVRHGTLRQASKCARRSSGRSTARISWTRSSTATARPATTTCSRPSIKYAINPEPVYSYDPEKAKSLLKKAGHREPQGRSLGLAMPPSRAASTRRC